MAPALLELAGGAVLDSRILHVASGEPGSIQLRGRRAMLYTIAVILLIMWLLGLVSGYTIGAFIHVLLVVALVLFLVGLLSGRRLV
jgi:hypothetical protein